MSPKNVAGVKLDITIDIANFGGEIKLFLCAAY